MNAILIGSGSDIAKGIQPMLEKEYAVFGWKQDYPVPIFLKWDLLILAVGRVAPVGNWWELRETEWMDCIESNLLLPFRILQQLWEFRNPNATVIWFAGSNPQKIMNGYAPYLTSKMAVLKLVEQLDHETPDAKFVAFGPGYAKTKIHKATLDANWPNERIARGDDGNSMEDIYKAMMFCVKAPKDMVGGCNICVSDTKNWQYFFIDGNYKLRRQELSVLDAMKTNK